jgi:hypothetical protein
MPRPLRVAVIARTVMPLHGVGGLERPFTISSASPPPATST